MEIKNIFVPLTKDAFNDFSRGKIFEIRKAERCWNRNQIYTGRGVTLSCGYSGSRRHGIIGKVIFGSLDDLFKKVSFRKIEPLAKSHVEAIRANRKLLGRSLEYVAFEVIMNGN